MPLQNRVDPWGELHAVPERGTMMGNRGGKFHRDDKTLGKRRWASSHWICCELHYKNMHHEAMGWGYTSLFFLDEVTALSAGHRPCFFCRRREAKAFLAGEKVGVFDERVHAERLSSFTLRRFAGGEALKGSFGRVVHASRAAARPPQHDGVVVELDGHAYALKGTHLLRWSFAGYTAAIPVRQPDRILTPPSILAILRRGYKPRWHPTAEQWDER